VSLTRLFVERPTLVFVLVALVTLGGFVAARSLIVSSPIRPGNRQEVRRNQSLQLRDQ